MSNFPWFRLYSEILSDRKLERVARETELPKTTVLGIWVGLLALANESPVRGQLLMVEGVPFTLEDMERELELDEGELQPVIDAFGLYRMVQWDEAILSIARWGDRQFESDTSTLRVRRYRERKADGNVPETLPDQSKDEPSPKKAPPKRKKKPVEVPPSIQAYREVTRLYPEKSLWSDIEAAVGKDVPRWTRVVKAWCSMGWNKRNVSGMMQFFQRDEMPGESNNGRKQSEPAVDDSWTKEDWSKDVVELEL